MDEVGKELCVARGETAVYLETLFLDFIWENERMPTLKMTNYQLACANQYITNGKLKVGCFFFFFFLILSC